METRLGVQAVPYTYLLGELIWPNIHIKRIVSTAPSHSWSKAQAMVKLFVRPSVPPNQGKNILLKKNVGYAKQS